MLEVLGVWTKFVSTKLLSLWKGCCMLLTALLGMGASLFLVIWVKLGCLPLPGRGSRDLGVASFDPAIPASSLTEVRSGDAFSLTGVARSLFCLDGPRVRSDFCLGVKELFSLLGVLDDLPGESPALSIFICDWRQNIPKLSLHSKYFFPSTVPLFFPLGSSSTTPETQL